jgi:hypothetical protein
VSNFEDFDDTPMPVEGRPLPEKQSGWAKTLAWAILMLGALRSLGIYLPEFIERRIQPTSRLPPPSDRE